MSVACLPSQSGRLRHSATKTGVVVELVLLRLVRIGVDRGYRVRLPGLVQPGTLPPYTVYHRTIVDGILNSSKADKC